MASATHTFWYIHRRAWPWPHIGEGNVETTLFLPNQRVHSPKLCTVPGEEKMAHKQGGVEASCIHPKVTTPRSNRYGSFTEWAFRTAQAESTIISASYFWNGRQAVPLVQFIHSSDVLWSDVSTPAFGILCRYRWFKSTVIHGATLGPTNTCHFCLPGLFKRTTVRVRATAQVGAIA